MKKLLLVFCASILIPPISFAKGDTPGLVIKPVYYTNKSPFLLEGFAQAGSEIEIHGQGIGFKVGDDGKFTVELKVEAGINLFAITASKDGASTTKGFMVEMDTTQPEVTLLVNNTPTRKIKQMISTLDTSELIITGFTESGCVIIADNNQFINEGIRFDAKFTLSKAPSKSDHLLTIIDIYGNKTQFEISITNQHRRKIIVQAENAKIEIDGLIDDMGSPAILVGDKTIMIPARLLASSILNGRLAYDGKTKIATIEIDDMTLEFQVGKDQVICNGEIYTTFGSPTFIKNNRLFVPIDVLRVFFYYRYVFDEIEKKAEYYIDIQP